jgi:hypothetical protein
MLQKKINFILLIYHLTKMKSLKLVISIIGPFWNPYMKCVIMSESQWVTFYKFINLLILLVIQNKYLHCIHIQINNFKKCPYHKF